ncbi:MAG: PhzF family phenazine biosynthesis protein [Snowella sp.]|nr:PhzF family phenazine biosynthesis protein [Snowella sp.]
MRYSFYTADVFTNQIFGGNPLAVFPHAQSLTDWQMQKIAAEINYSETVFVLPPRTPEGTKQLRIFTPKAELPFAGHPTVGTAYVLAHLGEISLIDPETRIVFEEGVGPVPVQILSHQGKPTYTELTASQLPAFGPEPPSIEHLAPMLSLNPEDLLTGEYAPEAVSCGLPFLFIPLKNQRVLAQARLQRDRWQDLLSNFWATCVYLFTLETSDPAIFLRSRMFAPALGIEEDPATGSAAAALGGYLGVRDRREGILQWQIEQGIEMGRPSLLTVKITKQENRIQQVCVGGSSVMVMEGMMEIPN